MAGTYPLPEAQLDRFLMRTSIGYPDHVAEVEVVSAHHDGARVTDIPPVLSREGVSALLQSVSAVSVDPLVIDYIVRIARATREHPGVTLGVSPRGSIGLLRASRALALLRNRDYVVPGDVQELAGPVLAHRIVLDADSQARGMTDSDVIRSIVASVPAPQPR
jgi:MoxR-like ATPase